MQLTKHTDFAFRTLIYLASMEDDMVTIGEIAKRFIVPKSHLMKVTSQLVAGGYVESIRGKQGGIRLAKEPHTILLSEIVQLMEPNLNPINCDSPACVIRENCQLRGVLYGAHNSYLNFLAQYTLADIQHPATTFTLHYTAKPKRAG